MQRTKWPKAFLGIGITQISSHMFFTSIPRYLNSLTVSKDILKRISITWNCKCCNYTGPYFVRPVSLVTSQDLLHGGRWRYHPNCLNLLCLVFHAV